MTELLLRAGEWDVVDPSSASWRYLSFRVDRLRNSDHVSRQTDGEEVALVPLGGKCIVQSLHADLPLDQAVRRGSVSGAIVASQLACSEAMPTLKELEAELV